MKKIRLTCILLMFFLSLTSEAQSITCPDPQTTSLKWGVPPAPWEINPFSANKPQADNSTQFVRANILLAGLGRGVVCTYKYSGGFYSIWWPVRVKIPAREDYNWIETYGGFVCTDSLMYCHFSVAIELFAG